MEDNMFSKDLFNKMILFEMLGHSEVSSEFCDRFFCQDFAYGSMKSEIVELVHEMFREGKIRGEDIGRGVTITNSDNTSSCLADDLTKMLLSCARNGNETAKKTILNLYRKHYRKEYEILKRFTVIDRNSIADIFDKSTLPGNPYSRLITIAELMGVENRDKELMYSIIENVTEATRELNEFISILDGNNEQTIAENHIEKIQFLAQLLQETGKDSVLASDSPLSTDSVSTEADTSKTAYVDLEVTCRKLEKENIELKKKYQLEKNNNKDLIEKNHTQTRTIEKNEKELAECKKKEIELIALREYAYLNTENDIEPYSLDLDKIKEDLGTQKIAIIGGHRNWMNKMSAIFPRWIFVEPSDSGALDVKRIAKVDYVFFFTGILSHHTYDRYLQKVQSTGLKFGYLDKTNISSSIKEIYQSLINDGIIVEYEGNGLGY